MEWYSGNCSYLPLPDIFCLLPGAVSVVHRQGSNLHEVSRAVKTTLENKIKYRSWTLFADTVMVWIWLFLFIFGKKSNSLLEQTRKVAKNDKNSF